MLRVAVQHREELPCHSIPEAWFITWPWPLELQVFPYHVNLQWPFSTIQVSFSSSVRIAAFHRCSTYLLTLVTGNYSFWMLFSRNKLWWGFQGRCEVVVTTPRHFVIGTESYSVTSPDIRITNGEIGDFILPTGPCQPGHLQISDASAKFPREGCWPGSTLTTDNAGIQSDDNTPNTKDLLQIWLPALGNAITWLQRIAKGYRSIKPCW